VLYLNTVSDKLHRLLIAIQSDFPDVRLVGGTALALQYGHRESIDLDFFGDVEEESQTIVEKLSKYGKVQTIKASKNIKVFIVDGIKVDFVNYNYPWIDQPIVQQGLTLASDKEIAAMKIAAITGRGSKKDFIDLYFLLDNYSLGEILNLYQLKYQDASIFLALKSLSFFEDADMQPNPKMFSNINWEAIKDRIRLVVNEYIV
jgi:predicted nucleotidyltransferase component of viral defense system